MRRQQWSSLNEPFPNRVIHWSLARTFSMEIHSQIMSWEKHFSRVEFFPRALTFFRREIVQLNCILLSHSLLLHFRLSFGKLPRFSKVPFAQFSLIDIWHKLIRVRDKVGLRMFQKYCRRSENFCLTVQPTRHSTLTPSWLCTSTCLP